MSTTNEQIANLYPLPVYRFVVSLGDIKVAFKSVSGLDINYDSIEYVDGLGNKYYMPGKRQKVSITLSKGVFRGENALYNWINGVTLNRVDKKDLMISLTDETGNEIFVTWNVLNAFPVGLKGPSLDAGTNDIAIQEVSLIADVVTIQTN